MRRGRPTFIHAWLRPLMALALGAATALGLAPLYFWPLLVLGFSGLLWLLRGQLGLSRAFAYGWLFGLGYFLVGLHWVGHAFLVDAERFAALMPFAVAALAAGLALFPAVATALTSRLSSTGVARLLTLALFWTLLEWLRGWLFTGFPWLFAGHAWAGSGFSLQSAAYFGSSGLGLFTVLAAAAPGLLIDSDRGRRRTAMLVCFAATLLASIVLALGYGRWQNSPVDFHPDIRLRLVQAGIAQADKWRPDLRDQNLSLYLRLSLAPGRDGRNPDYTHLIWPETATPFFLANDDKRRQLIAQNLPAGSRLITGTPRRASSRQGTLELFNSVFALDTDGRAEAKYDKQHLVPFGEYLPFRGFFARLSLDKLAHGAVDFTAGSGPRTVIVPGVPPLRPLICYEIIFPREILPDREDVRPEWLLNLTNDAWFGDSFGPRQHLDIARIRAVEFGLPVVRAANTGISAFIDPYGRISQQLPLGASGVIDGRLPMALTETAYARFGDGIFALLCVLLSAVLFFCHRHAARARRFAP